MTEIFEKYLTEQSDYKAWEIETKEKKGLVAQMARGAAKILGKDKLYKVTKGKDRQVIGIVAAGSEEDAIRKAKKIS